MNPLQKYGQCAKWASAFHNYLYIYIYIYISIYYTRIYVLLVSVRQHRLGYSKGVKLAMRPIIVEKKWPAARPPSSGFVDQYYSSDHKSSCCDCFYMRQTSESFLGVSALHGRTKTPTLSLHGCAKPRKDAYANAATSSFGKCLRRLSS